MDSADIRGGMPIPTSGQGAGGVSCRGVGRASSEAAGPTDSSCTDHGAQDFGQLTKPNPTERASCKLIGEGRDPRNRGVRRLLTEIDEERP